VIATSSIGVLARAGACVDGSDGGKPRGEETRGEGCGEETRGKGCGEACGTRAAHCSGTGAGAAARALSTHAIIVA
jgi:hypothetical protein